MHSAHPPEREQSLLSVHGLSVRYGSAHGALSNVTIEVRPGHSCAVLGGNGAGKTTLMRAICGTLRRNNGAQAAGSVAMRGNSMDGWSTDARTRAGVVLVPEGRRVFGRLNVMDNLRVGALTNTGDRHAAYERVFDLFPVLADKRSHRAALLSGGEQQMLAIGRGLVAAPELLLLDEPTLGLAPRIIEQVAEMLRRVQDDGTPLLLAEQNAVALDLADDAYVLATGEVALEGPAEQLRGDDRVRRLYIGATQDSREQAKS